MADLLNMERINQLPQPFVTRLLGDKEFLYEIESIDVQTGLLRINVCGLLQVSHISEISSFRDAQGKEHDPETFYADYETTNTQKG